MKTIIAFALSLCCIVSNAQTKDIIPLSDYTIPASSAKVFYITGEYHGVSSNNKVEEHFYKELIEKHNVRTIIEEASCSKAYLINKYLETNDTVFLNQCVSEAPYYFKEIKDKFENLYKVNASLHDTDKIKVIGIDVWETDELPYMQNLFRLLIKTEIKNSELQLFITSIIQSDSFPNNLSEIKNTLKNFNNPFDYTSDFENVVNSYLTWQREFKPTFWSGKTMQKREQYLYQNVMNNKFAFRGNLYANFGSAHIDTTNQFGGMLAHLLEKDTAFKYPIINYFPFYYNCKTLLPLKFKKAVPYYLISLKSRVKKANLPTGIYFTQQKKKRYIIHVNQPAMTKLK